MEVIFLARVGLEEAGRILGVSSETVRRRLKKGELNGEKVKTDHGYQWFVELEELVPVEVPSTVVDVVELNRALSPDELVAIVQAAQAPLALQIEQQAAVINELAAKVDELSAAVKESEPEKVGWWRRLFGG